MVTKREAPLIGGNVSLRPAEAADRVFERLAYAASRALELENCGWAEAERTAFLDHQFTMQDRHYRTAFEGAEFFIIVVEGEDAGRLIIHRGETVTELMDIVLLPAWRGRGIGAALIRRCMEEAASSGGSMRLWVEEFNPALRLYERLGFIRGGGAHGPHLELIWSPIRS